MRCVQRRVGHHVSRVCWLARCDNNSPQFAVYSNCMIRFLAQTPTKCTNLQWMQKKFGSIYTQTSTSPLTRKGTAEHFRDKIYQTRTATRCRRGKKKRRKKLGVGSHPSCVCTYSMHVHQHVNNVVLAVEVMLTKKYNKNIKTLAPTKSPTQTPLFLEISRMAACHQYAGLYLPFTSKTNRELRVLLHEFQTSNMLVKGGPPKADVLSTSPPAVAQ